VDDVLNSIWDVLDGFTLRTYNITTAADLSAEIGDRIKIKDYQGNYTYSWITTNSFKLAAQIIQCNAQPPNRTLIKRYSKEVKAAVEVARKQSVQLISTYDQSVQRLNKLVEQSMGAFSDYEDSANGGRIYYISNMPITKNSSGHCVFTSGSIVWRMAGDVFSVSNDGGVTWQNGYDPQTGELIVNVLSAIGIQAEWIRTGTLTVGGATGGTEYPTIEVYDASDNLIVEINRNGITMHSGVISSPDFVAGTSLDPYAVAGMGIDVNQKYIQSPQFAIDEYGAYFKGTVQITGDYEIGTNNFRFIPYDYNITSSFAIKFTVSGEPSGTSTASVDWHKFELVSGTWTETVINQGTETFTDDCTITCPAVGSNGQDYLQISVTSSNTVKASLHNTTLAYVGRDGFRGRLEGQFVGHSESNAGKIAGFTYGAGTTKSYVGQDIEGLFTTTDGFEFSMKDGFSRPNGSLIKLYDNVYNLGNAGGMFTFFKSDSQGGGANSNSIKIDGYNKTITKCDSNGNPEGTVLWNDGTVYTNSRVTASTTDITAGTTQLPTGDLYLVYE